MSDTDRRYLQLAAEARDATGEVSTGDISRAMYGNPHSASQSRDRLIARHQVLEAGRRGKVRFAIPGFADWLEQMPPSDTRRRRMDTLAIHRHPPPTSTILRRHRHRLVAGNPVCAVANSRRAASKPPGHVRQSGPSVGGRQRIPVAASFRRPLTRRTRMRSEMRPHHGQARVASARAVTSLRSGEVGEQFLPPGPPPTPTPPTGDAAESQVRRHRWSDTAAQPPRIQPSVSRHRPQCSVFGRRTSCSTPDGDVVG